MCICPPRTQKRQVSQWGFDTVFHGLNPENNRFYSGKQMHYFSSSVLYPTTSSSTDPTMRKAKNSPNFVAFNALEQVNISWVRRPPLVVKGSSWADRETPKESTKIPREQTLSPGHPHKRHPDILPLFPQPSQTPINLPALRPRLGSSGATGKQKRPAGCLTPPAHPPGRVRDGELSLLLQAACSDWHRGAGRWIPDAWMPASSHLFSCLPVNYPP